MNLDPDKGDNYNNNNNNNNNNNSNDDDDIDDDDNNKEEEKEEVEEEEEKEKKFLRTDQPKVVQEVLADLKRCNMVATNLVLCNASFETSGYGNDMCVIWQIERKQREY